MKKHKLLLVLPALLIGQSANASSSFLNYKSPYRVGVIDQIRQKPEGGTQEPGTEFLSGSVLRVKGKDVNSPVPCTSKTCQHIEFVDIPGISNVMNALGGVGQTKNPISVLGNRWEVGPDHIVPGGFGVLAVGPLGLEPTGRLVVQGIDGPAAIKIVLVNVNEERKMATFQGYGRNCIKTPFKGWTSCTAFNIPLPMFILLPLNSPMPIDIKIPTGGINPLPLTDKAKSVQASFAAKIKQSLISQGLQIGTGVLSGGIGGGSNGASNATPNSGSSSPVPSTPVRATSGGGSGVWNGSFNGVTVKPVPAQYTVTSGYGWRNHPISGGQKFHDGIDLAAPTGSPVLAAAAGKVIFQGVKGGYGNTIIIDHGNGYSTLYGHLSGFLQGGVGVLVPAGAPIGMVGSTGNSTGPHLHFNVQKDGGNVDPNTFVRGL